MKVCLNCLARFQADDWRCPQCGCTPESHEGFLSFSPELAESNDGFDRAYFEQLAEREAGHFWFRGRNRLVSQSLRTYFPHAENFLEIGGGTGFVLSGLRQAFPQMTLSGSDIFSKGLDFAQSRLPGVNFFQMDARRIPYENEFDVVGAFDVLEHIEEDEAVFAQMRQALKPGGGIMVTVPQHQFLWSALDDYSFHKRRYSRQELVKKVEQAGFEVLYVTSFVFFLLPVMLVSRFKMRKQSTNVDPLTEYRLTPMMNTVGEKILSLEGSLISRGVSLPAGGSLLIIARRQES